MRHCRTRRAMRPSRPIERHTGLIRAGITEIGIKREMSSGTIEAQHPDAGFGRRFVHYDDARTVAGNPMRSLFLNRLAAFATATICGRRVALEPMSGHAVGAQAASHAFKLYALAQRLGYCRRANANRVFPAVTAMYCLPPAM